MEGKIYIIGHIGIIDDIRGALLVDVVEQVKNQPEATSFTVHIDSPGGEVEVGEDIYKYLKALGKKKPIKTVGSNMVASIATVIFMAGSTRTVNEGCEFMIHLPMGGIDYATAEELENYSKVIKNIENRMVNFYADVTGMEKEAIKPLLKNETWLTPEQLKSFGFITGDTPLRITAKAKVNINPKKKKMSKKSKKGKKGVWAKLTAMLDEFENAGKKAKALILLAADQTEVDFYELEEGTEISVGAKARIGGKDAEGEITMTDGRLVIFESGAVKEIKDAPGGGDDDTEAMQQKIDALEADKANQAEQVTALKKELKAKTKIVSKIKKIQSKLSDDDDGRGRKGGAGAKRKKRKGKFASAMSNMKKLQE